MEPRSRSETPNAQDDEFIEDDLDHDNNSSTFKLTDNILSSEETPEDCTDSDCSSI